MVIRGHFQRFPLEARAHTLTVHVGKTWRGDSSRGGSSDAPIAAPHGFFPGDASI
jgi:hypothetical protein